MDLKFEGLKEYHALYSYIENAYQESKANYLFIDEVQLCPQFELAVNSLHGEQKYDIYLTGSNAFLLSADLATLFTGRYIEIEMFTLTFYEFLEMKKFLGKEVSNNSKDYGFKTVQHKPATGR